jgi:hypothetical protein
MHAFGHLKVLVLELVEFPEGHGLSVFSFDAFRQIQAVHKQPNDERSSTIVKIITRSMYPRNPRTTPHAVMYSVRSEILTVSIGGRRRTVSQFDSAPVRTVRPYAFRLSLAG